MIKKAIIFGAGYHGRNALRACKKKKIKVLFFVDNEKKLHRSKILGKKIFDPKVINNFEFEKIIISGRNIKQIHKQLLDLKVDKKKLVFWGKKELKLTNKYFKRRSVEIYKSLDKIINYLNKHKMIFWLDLGSLLIVFRSQNLAETSDVDILIKYEDLKKIRKVCKIICLKNKSFIFKEKKVYKSKILKKEHISQFSITVPKDKNFYYEPPVFEFNLLVSNKKNFENLAKKKVFKNNFWVSCQPKKHKKLILPVPKNAKKYLSSLYGKNWNVKKNFFSN